MQKYMMHQIPPGKASTTVFPASVYFLIQDNVFKVDPNKPLHWQTYVGNKVARLFCTKLPTQRKDYTFLEQWCVSLGCGKIFPRG